MPLIIEEGPNTFRAYRDDPPLEWDQWWCFTWLNETQRLRSIKRERRRARARLAPRG